jgi:hypothetical protein
MHGLPPPSQAKSWLITGVWLTLDLLASHGSARGMWGFPLLSAATQEWGLALIGFAVIR